MRNDRANGEAERPNRLCNDSSSLSLSPHRLSYRTGQDTANCDTCRNSACIIYRLVAVFCLKPEIHERAVLIKINCSLITDCVSNEQDKERKYYRWQEDVGYSIKDLCGTPSSQSTGTMLSGCRNSSSEYYNLVIIYSYSTSAALYI